MERGADTEGVVNEAEARAAARQHLDQKRSSVELVILDELTREEDFGWVFFYQSAEYLKSGATRDALAGNAPLVVLRDSGEVRATGTALPLDSYLEQFREGNASGG
jgi:hypothetical protein